MPTEAALHIATAQQLVTFAPAGVRRAGLTPDDLAAMRASARKLLAIAADIGDLNEVAASCGILCTLAATAGERYTYAARGAVYGNTDCQEIIGMIGQLSEADNAGLAAAYAREQADFDADRD